MYSIGNLVIHKLCEQMHDIMIVIVRLSRMCMSNVNELISEKSEEGERWNQKRYQKVQKEKPQLPLNGSLPLSGTQEFTLEPLTGKMAAEGKKLLTHSPLSSMSASDSGLGKSRRGQGVTRVADVTSGRVDDQRRHVDIERFKSTSSISDDTIKQIRQE
ncbi:hypothetical protein LR48_Vigan05g091900 [Vigna angularis]|uniref:Uncharacterized protein n=1 Tax=Phaseolus angularis TaxID=3914 RepID=A0A0L9UK88_PHAAN|nr:hypothetical protein LR48_Vigan05g091900 [Vigna angularis]